MVGFVSSRRPRHSLYRRKSGQIRVGERFCDVSLDEAISCSIVALPLRYLVAPGAGNPHGNVGFNAESGSFSEPVFRVQSTPQLGSVRESDASIVARAGEKKDIGFVLRLSSRDGGIGSQVPFLRFSSLARIRRASFGPSESQRHGGPGIKETAHALRRLGAK